MLKTFKNSWREVGLCALVLGNLFTWYAVHAESRAGLLTVSFLDVGQGDAILIDGPSGIQVLIDGGRGKKVLSELGEVLPFYDRSIDVIIATHPDQDHMEGLIGVPERYDNLLFIEPDLTTDKPFQIKLRELVKAKGVQELFAQAGQSIALGDGATLTILFPDLDVSNWQDITNNASVVALLEYGQTSFLFTGDSPSAIESRLVKELSGVLDVDVLKVGHHGSRTSSSQAFIDATSPEFAIISAGKDNSYGHPHGEVIERLRVVGANILSTAEVGRITIKSDGTSLKLSN
ncbi:MAG TPA: MBL fold metallo-hydrolase [Candidatus Paceibacterota bacterium]